MITYHIKKDKSKYILIEREYQATGDKPDYRKICVLNQNEALTLVKSSIFQQDFEIDKKSIKQNELKLKDLIKIDLIENIHHIKLILPKNELRQFELSVYIKDFDD